MCRSKNNAVFRHPYRQEVVESEISDPPILAGVKFITHLKVGNILLPGIPGQNAFRFYKKRTLCVCGVKGA